MRGFFTKSIFCLLYKSDAADDMQCVDLGGRRIIKKIDPKIFDYEIDILKKMGCLLYTSPSPLD